MSTISGITHRSSRESTPSLSLSRLPLKRHKTGSSSDRRSIKRFTSCGNTVGDKTFLGAHNTSPPPKIPTKKRKLSKELEHSVRVQTSWT